MGEWGEDTVEEEERQLAGILGRYEAEEGLVDWEVKESGIIVFLC